MNFFACDVDEHAHWIFALFYSLIVDTISAFAIFLLFFIIYSFFQARKYRLLMYPFSLNHGFLYPKFNNL